MDREDFTVYGIQNPREFTGYLKLQEFETLLCQYLEMQPMYKAIREIYQMQLTDQTLLPASKLDVQTIFGIIHSAAFIERTPRFLNNMYTSQSVKIIEASLIIYLRQLLKLNDIRNAIMIFVLKEIEHQTTGLPLDSEVITGLFWKMNKTMSNDILKEWMRRCNDILEHKGIIQVHEFLYLVCNTTNRHQFIEKIPNIQMDRERDKIEAAQASTQKNPEDKIQNYMKYQFNMEKMIFDGRSLAKKDDYYAQKRKNKMDQIMKSDDNFHVEFRKMLRDQELYEEIKIRLRNANQLINQAKINGKHFGTRKATRGVGGDEDENGDTYESSEENNMESDRLQKQQGDNHAHIAVAGANNKVDLVLSTPTYQLKSNQRQQSAFITQVKQEVNLERQIAKNQNYMKEQHQLMQLQQQGSHGPPKMAKRMSVGNFRKPSSAVGSAGGLPGMHAASIGGAGGMRPQTAHPKMVGSFSAAKIYPAGHNLNNRAGLKSAASHSTVATLGSQAFFGNAANAAGGIVQGLASINPTPRPLSSVSSGSQLFKPFHQRMLLSSAKQQRKKDSIPLLQDSHEVLMNLDEELDCWEQFQHASNGPADNKIFVPFGNVNKKNYSINVPWETSHSATRATSP